MLFRILYNRWVSAYRSKQRRPQEFPLDEITDRDPSVGLRSAEAEALDALPDSEIKAAMDALPEGFRSVVYYADVQGYTYAENRSDLERPDGNSHVAGVTRPAATAHRIG